MHSSDLTDQPPEPKKKKKSALITLLGDDFESDRSSQTSSTCSSSVSVKDVVQSEILRYKSEPSIPLEGEHPLKWWEKMSTYIPIWLLWPVSICV